MSRDDFEPMVARLLAQANSVVRGKEIREILNGDPRPCWRCRYHLRLDLLDHGMVVRVTPLAIRAARRGGFGLTALALCGFLFAKFLSLAALLIPMHAGCDVFGDD